MRRSGGQTPTFDHVTQNINMGGDLNGGGINSAGLDGMLFLAIDRSGGPTNNNIYMLASVLPPGRSTTDVMFVRSTDDGLTFSAPHRINDDGLTNKWHWFGTFSVAPNGRLDAVWYDSRNSVANNTDSQLFYSYSTDAGVTWSPNVAVSNCVQSLSRGIRTRIRSAIISPLFRTIPAATWRIPPLLISTRAGANTKKISTTFGYRRRAAARRRPRLPQVRHRVRRLQPRPQLQPQLLLHRQQQLQLLLAATATATPTATSTPTATATPRPTPTPRAQATPRARPTPPPRP